MREVRIRPRVRASSSDCGAPDPPGVVGLSQVVSWARGGRGVGGGRVFRAHEADARQRVCWSGERKVAVDVAGPDGAAEWSGGPQAAAVAKDGSGCVGWGAGTGRPGRAGVCGWRIPKVGGAAVELIPTSLGRLTAGSRQFAENTC